MNEFINNINEVIKLIGNEGCVKCYEYQKTNMPNIYAYGCRVFGRDIIEYVNSL